ncbi:MAG: hypothetical protein AUG49_26160 [Catenulispora sp. 13_1_20CM_3_70_7]|nr:MAG: hypothetical protein AUG49_26160 [Catenulispora sp. 13_1_20CM_3_70_7]
MAVTEPAPAADQNPYSGPYPDPHSAWSPPAEQWAPPVPPPWRPTAAERLRAAAVGALNLSGLGLGYVMARRWVAAGVCWVATGILLLVALPARPEGVPGGVVAAYLVFLVIVAVHGAVRALRTPVPWPRQTWVAAALALVLLAVPAGGAVLYDDARSNAVQTMLLGRLKQADDLVATARAQSFDNARPTYGAALTGYRDLLTDHRGSRAGKLVPDRLAAFYQTVAAPFTDGRFCEAVTPLAYLRTVPDTIPARELGSLATWPDDRLATSLLRCGTPAFEAADGSPGATSYFKQLITTFPSSAQAAQVPAAAAAAVDGTAAGLTGPDPCGATAKLRKLVTQISNLTAAPWNQAADQTTALKKDSDTATHDVESGTFACGKNQYAKGDFDAAGKTMQSFVTDYPKNPDNALAGKYVIAAQIAQKEPAAGKQPPTLATGGSVTITITNDSPVAVDILYTGSATGKVHVDACTSSCVAYRTTQEAKAISCADASIDYPHASVTVPPGTVYILEDNFSSSNPPKVITEQATPDETHDFCAYQIDPLSPFTHVPPPPVAG